MSEHNETPWYANGHAVYMGADGGFSLRCCPNPEANARHIALCVNAHDRLMKALADVTENLEHARFMVPDDEVSSMLFDSTRDARELLAELEREQ